jgi:hypothetical protein
VGHVFQNRYKSQRCFSQAYFRYLVCYIHLNPAEAGIVPDIGALSRWPWTGHSCILEGQGPAWQDTSLALAAFGNTPGSSRDGYLEYMAQVLKDHGRGPSPATSRKLEHIRIRKADGENWAWKERIPESEEGVGQELNAIPQTNHPATKLAMQGWDLEKLAQVVSAHYQVPPKALLRKGRANNTAKARQAFAWMALHHLGHPRKNVIAHLDISCSTLCRLLHQAAYLPDLPTIP